MKLKISRYEYTSCIYLFGFYKKARNFWAKVGDIMNINTLSTNELEHKDGTLPVALYPNNIAKSKDEKTAFML